MTPQNKKYTFTLYNKDELLSLKDKSIEIEKALSEVKKDKSGLIRCNSLIIEKSYIEIAVMENSLEWHKKFPSILKNNYGMAVYCKGNSMFKVEEI